MREGWKSCSLETVCEVERGTTITRKKATPGDVPVVAGGMLPTYSHSVANRPAGTITISGSGANAGYVNFYDVPIFASDCSTVRPRDTSKLDVRFVLYFLKSQQQYISTRLRQGAAQPHVYARDIARLTIGFPSLVEQQRIVAILDDAFGGIGIAIANARKNLENTRELFDAHLRHVFRTKQKGWIEKTLGEVCSLITDGKHGDCANESNSGYYFLSAKDIRNGTLNYDDARQIAKADFEETHRRTSLEPGDILVTNAGTIGRIAIAPAAERTRRTTFQKSVAVLKPARSLVSSSFCAYSLRACLIDLQNLSAGTAQKNLLLRDLRSLQFWMPNLRKQEVIVGELEDIAGATRRLENLYRDKVSSLEKLGQSLLDRAFSGELTSPPSSAVQEAAE